MIGDKTIDELARLEQSCSVSAASVPTSQNEPALHAFRLMNFDKLKIAIFLIVLSMVVLIMLTRSWG